jgi:hypothetical protein
MALVPGARIEELWAYVAIDKDDIEGIVSASVPGLGHVPLVGADKERMLSYKSYAKMTARVTGAKIKLVRFSTREEIEAF